MLQGSVVGSTLFNLFLMIFYRFFLIKSVHNFADVDSLKQTLDSECKLDIKWFHENKMIVNPDKFQAIILDERRSSDTKVKFMIGSEHIQPVP